MTDNIMNMTFGGRCEKHLKPKPCSQCLEESELAKPEKPTSIHTTQRWNIERDGEDLLICFNAHDKGEKCEYHRYSPKPEQPDPWLQQALKQAYEYGKADGVKQRHTEAEVQELLNNRHGHPTVFERIARRLLGVPASQ